MAVHLVILHNSHVCKSLFIAIKVFCHRRLLSSPMRDVKTMAFDPVM